MKKVKSEIAYVLLYIPTNRIQVRGGLSYDKKDIEPNPLYRKAFKAIKVKIIPLKTKWKKKKI